MPNRRKKSAALHRKRMLAKGELQRPRKGERLK